MKAFQYAFKLRMVMVVAFEKEFYQDQPCYSSILIESQEKVVWTLPSSAKVSAQLS